jgi:hypothetical protein
MAPISISQLVTRCTGILKKSTNMLINTSPNLPPRASKNNLKLIKEILKDRNEIIHTEKYPEKSNLKLYYEFISNFMDIVDK